MLSMFAFAAEAAYEPVLTSEEIFSQSNGQMAIPDFTAGFIYGLTGDLELDAVQQCMVSASGLEKYIASFASNIKDLHIFQAMLDI